MGIPHSTAYQIFAQARAGWSEGAAEVDRGDGVFEDRASVFHNEKRPPESVTGNGREHLHE
jgi:hypothetical protein